MVHEFDLIRNIKKLNPKNDIFITTYKYKRGFFESFIFPRFVNYGFPLILIDYNEYQKNIFDIGQSKFAEKKYFIESINLKNPNRKFHPKLFLSLGKDKLKIWIGSNNLSLQGYTDNAELIIPITFNFKNDTNIEILYDICDFIKNLNLFIGSSSHRKRLDNIYKKILKKIPKSETIPHSNLWILHNINNNFFKQFESIINKPIDEIIVISPYFSQDEQFYKDILKYCKSIHIIIQQGTNNLPKKILEDIKQLKFSILNVPNNRFLHAKLLLFKTSDQNFIFTGSANFTRSALLTTNNIELGVLIKSKLVLEDIIKNFGTLQKVNLTEINIDSLKPFEIYPSDVDFRILGAKILGNNRLQLELEKELEEGTIKLIIGRNEKSYPFTKEENIIEFEIPEDKMKFLLETGFVKIEYISNGKKLKSDYKLLYNPVQFPIKYNLLNSFDINDSNWLISIILKLESIAQFQDYVPILKKLDELDIFTKPNKEKILLNSRKKILSIKPLNKIYTPKEIINEIIERHLRKIRNAVKKDDNKTPYRVIETFIYINKLIFGSIMSKFNKIDILSRVRNNLDAILLKDLNYLSMLTLQEKINLIQETKLKYHAVVIAYIMHSLLEKRVEVDITYTTIKNVLEEKIIQFLQRLIELDDNKFKDEIINKILYDYEHIFKEILRIKKNQRGIYILLKLNEILKPNINLEYIENESN